MNLYSGSLLWVDNYCDVPQYPVLTADVTCDVVIIGAGEAGALCAWYLSESGLDTVIIDKRSVGRGSTSCNTGLLQFLNDMPLYKMSDVHGIHEAVRFYKLCQQGVDELERICRLLPQRTDFIRRNSLMYATVEKDVLQLENEFRVLRQHDFPVEFLTKRQISERFSFEREAGLYTMGDAEVNPYRLTHALIQAAAKKNLRVFEMTEVESLKYKGNQPTFHTKNGCKISAKKAVITMGYETQDLESTPGALLSSSYAIATKPVHSFPGWNDRCLIWETARPYRYFRTTTDARIIAGGLDELKTESVARDALLESKADELLQTVKTMFPAIDDLELDYMWAATFGSSKDGVPFVGKHPNLENCYLCLGYGGNGTVYYAVGAQIIRDLILYNHSPDSFLLNPNRQRWYKKVVKKVGHTVGVY